MKSNNNNKKEYLKEEYVLLRNSISKKQDSLLSILAFTLTAITTITGFIISKNSLSLSNVIVLSNCSLFIILSSFIIIIRHIYAIKTIGGYIQYKLEPHLFNNNLAGWESYVVKLNNSKRKSFFILKGGNHMTFSFFYLFLCISTVLTLIDQMNINQLCIEDITIIDWIFISITISLCLFLIILIIGLNKHAKHWKSDWSNC